MSCEQEGCGAPPHPRLVPGWSLPSPPALLLPDVPASTDPLSSLCARALWWLGRLRQLRVLKVEAVLRAPLRASFVAAAAAAAEGGNPPPLRLGLHFTLDENAMSICEGGLDASLRSGRAVMGDGEYFADNVETGLPYAEGALLTREWMVLIHTLTYIRVIA